MAVTLQSVTAALDDIAPPHLAEPWDNVGLLIEPNRRQNVERILLTIDLTARVVEEAVDRRCSLVVAYHPPVFHPIKRLMSGDPPTESIRRGIAVYSPHTALDAVEGGVNDWLLDRLGKGERHPIRAADGTDGGDTHKVVTFVPPNALDRVRQAMARAGAGGIGHYDLCSFNTPGFGTFRGDETTNPAVGQRGRLEKVEEVRLEMICGASALPRVAEAIRGSHPYEEPAWEVHALVARPSLNMGQGRLLELDTAVTLEAVIRRVKKHLGLSRVRAARGGSTKVRTIAACAGAGGSILSGAKADVYLTGEMRHHDVVAANARGTSVVLCDHTNTERGYLPVLKAKIHEKLGGKVRVDISRVDREPLEIV